MILSICVVAALFCSVLICSLLFCFILFLNLILRSYSTSELFTTDVNHHYNRNIILSSFKSSACLILFLNILSHMISFVLFYFIIYSLFHSFSSLINLLHSTLLHFILLCELVFILYYLILSQIPLARIESYSQWEYERPVYAAAGHHLQRSH